MSRAPFLVAPLDAAHDRTAFNNGSEPLDRYLREVVTQDIRRRVTACFIALAGGQRIAGYYTLASASLLLADLPATTAKKLPRFRPCQWYEWAVWPSIKHSRDKGSAGRC